MTTPTDAPNRRGMILWIVNLLLFFAGVWFTTRWQPPQGTYPDRPIDVVVPFSAGGGSDVYGRIFKTAIDENSDFPVPIVIQNRGGAGGTIGSRYVRDAAADGYTVLLLHDALITAKYSGMVNYGPEAFEPVACTGELGMVIAVPAKSPYQTLDDLLDAAAEKPGTLSFAVNRGALTHVAGLQLEQYREGVGFQFPQSGGGSDRFQDLIGGHVDATGFSLEEFLRFREGEDGEPALRGLAYLDTKRNPAVPEVPTAVEQGLDIVIINYFYWWMPKGTPPERIEKFGKALETAVFQNPYLIDRMNEMRCERIFRTGAELKEQLQKSEHTISQVEFETPQGIPNLARGVFMALAALFGFWVIRLQNRSLTVGFFSVLLVCIVFENVFTKIDGFGVFVGFCLVGLLLSQIGALLKHRTVMGCLVCILAYVGLLTIGWGDFRWLTGLFVILVSLLLAPQTHRRLPAIGLLAQILAFGVFSVFQFVFEVPLPG